MNLFVRCCLMMSLVVGIVTAAGYAQPAWLADIGLDFWSLPKYQQIIMRQKARQEELAQMFAGVKLRSQRKDAVLQALIEKRISLREAASQIEALSTPDFLVKVACTLSPTPNASPKEQCCHFIIYWVDNMAARMNPRQAAEIRQRLKAELRELVSRDNGNRIDS